MQKLAIALLAVLAINTVSAEWAIFGLYTSDTCSGDPFIYTALKYDECFVHSSIESVKTDGSSFEFWNAGNCDGDADATDDDITACFAWGESSSSFHAEAAATGLSSPYNDDFPVAVGVFSGDECDDYSELTGRIVVYDADTAEPIVEGFEAVIDAGADYGFNDCYQASGFSSIYWYNDSGSIITATLFSAVAVLAIIFA
mmetsp:Transcript_39746/g.35473  ORF Transcript_39746/g.35473 Transcript_39746/m.35473 type:complete len:200 (-) Transcript_39746:139-738(-)